MLVPSVSPSPSPPSAPPNKPPMSNSAVEKVVWKSAEASFEVIVNSGEVKRWRADKSIPLVDVAQREFDKSWTSNVVADVFCGRIRGVYGVG